MIARVFRAKIVESLCQDFEEKFLSVSIPLTKGQPGLVSVQIGRPVSTPAEYVMISVWESEQAVKDFVGDDWDKGYIPKGMEIYIEDCWVHHYEIFG